jgi:hypothetical protein
MVVGSCFNGCFFFLCFVGSTVGRNADAVVGRLSYLEGGLSRLRFGGEGLGYRRFLAANVCAAGWLPFTVGRWSVWFGDHSWIPYEPFGYITHHYGKGIFVCGFWDCVPSTHHGRVYKLSSLFLMHFLLFRTGGMVILNRLDWLGAVSSL